MRTLIFALLLMLASNVQGQQEFSGGVIAGPVTTQISGDGLGGWDKFGLCAGGWVRLPMGSRSGLLLHLIYINKGSLRVDTLTHTSYGFALDYIEFPVLFDRRMKILNEKFNFQIGPSVGINIRQKVKSNGAFYEPNPAFNRLDIGITGGIAYQINTKYQLALRSSTSLFPVRPAPTVPVPNSYYLKGNYNQTLQLLFSIRF